MIATTMFAVLCAANQVAGWAAENNMDPMKTKVDPTTISTNPGLVITENVTGSDTDTFWRPSAVDPKQKEEKLFPSMDIVVDHGAINSGTLLTFNLTSTDDKGAITGTATTKVKDMPDGADSLTVTDYYTVTDNGPDPVNDGTRTLGIAVTITRPPKPPVTPVDPPVPPKS